MPGNEAEPAAILPAVQAWRALAPEQQAAQRLRHIRAKVARSMAFEGEPVPEGWVEARQPHRSAPPNAPKFQPGMQSHADLAPWLADKIAHVETANAGGGYADTPLDEYLILELHRDIAAELLPNIGGRWRQIDVQVGGHEAPPHHRVPELMRVYALDLKARLAGIAEHGTERLLETLAFAEGRLLCIHPFADLNGRTTRVFLSELLRRLRLPVIDSTPDEGAATTAYLQALRSADRADWQPLIVLWRQRFENEGRT